MKLNYRGVEYDNTAVTADANTENGTYRGVPTTFDAPPATLPETELKFRGSVYSYYVEPQADAIAPAAAVAPAAATPTVTLDAEDRARALMMNRHRTVKRRQQVMMLRMANQVGLAVDDASHYWNHIQGKVHPSFWATYDRSGAALS